MAGAASGNLPDVFMNAQSVGAQLVEVGAPDNLHDRLMAMPEGYRARSDEEALKGCMRGTDQLYCLPCIGFGSLLFRNLTVLEKAGIDPTPPKTWNEWFTRMEAVKAAGIYAIPDNTPAFHAIGEIYATSDGNDSRGFDWDDRQARIDPQTMACVMRKFVDMVPLNTGTSRDDQANKDLFIPDQLAFHTVGPWVNPTHAEAARTSGLKYDFVLIPGDTEGKTGGVRSYEMIGVAPGPNADPAFEFAAFLTEKTQMARWAKLRSRYNTNAAAMADPKVAALPLIEVSVTAAHGATDTAAPYFVDSVPNCHDATMVDYVSAVADGEFTPEDGANELVAELNDCLAQ